MGATRPALIAEIGANLMSGNDLACGRDYAKLVKDGEIDQMFREIGELGWMVLTKSLKMKEIDGKRERLVQLKLVDPDSAEARDLP